jgi:GT2 family glycosyltransferase
LQHGGELNRRIDVRRGAWENHGKRHMEPAALTAPSVSIVILNFNGADLLPGLLNSLQGLSYADYEVIVVENGSRDNSIEVLSRYPWVRVVQTKRNLGSSGGYNLGVSHAMGEFVLIMNNDIIANRDFVSFLSRYLVDHPSVGIVQAKMVLPRCDGRLEVCGSFFTRFGFPYHYGYYKVDAPKYEQSQPVFCGKGACMMFRRGIIQAVGGYVFNEDFHCYYEESDLCHRAWLAGFETHFVASPPIQHLAGVTIAREENAGFTLYHYLRNMIFSLLTILQTSWLLRIMPLFLAVFVASMCVAFLTGRRSTASAHWNALIHNVRNIRKIRSQRARIQAFRKQPDRDIFAKVLRNPRLEYFTRTFTGDLANYRD